ncbi:MAG: NAD(P)-dependent alcohol dehydrogenase [Verrucomicrobia bacterium]|nr:MAG: NAD(P)-dependent alcohol dehydrogenase [Verrucomicrobiota bacterium]
MNQKPFSITKAYAALSAKTPLVPYSLERRSLEPHDVAISIDYCGVCHSDIHQARNEWSGSTYPIVPGHEIVGHVKGVGTHVTKFQLGDVVGVGVMVDSCRSCGSCKEGLEQFCEQGFSSTYNGTEQDKKTPTYGGYSEHIVVQEDFVLRLPKHLPLAALAPLLCAGITTYSPLRHWNVRAGQKVAVIGIGGLGHMAIKFAHALGAKTFAITTSPDKKIDALQLGAEDIVVSTDEESMKKHLESFDFILNTISAPYNISHYLNLLKRDGKMAIVGAPSKPIEFMLFDLIRGRKTVAGSLIGGIKETQEMLDFCGEHNITADIELISIEEINNAFERMIRSDVHYRFVIDMATLQNT